jgi:hypothetical protein
VDANLAEARFYVDSEDNLFSRLFGLGSEYGSLLRHIEIGFLSVVHVAASAECFAVSPKGPGAEVLVFVFRQLQRPI